MLWQTLDDVGGLSPFDRLTDGGSAEASANGVQPLLNFVDAMLFNSRDIGDASALEDPPDVYRFNGL
jgi:hypothetical protein